MKQSKQCEHTAETTATERGEIIHEGQATLLYGGMQAVVLISNDAT